MRKYGFYSLAVGVFLAAACNSAELTGAAPGSVTPGDPNPAEDDDPNGDGGSKSNGDDDDAGPVQKVAIAMSQGVTIQVMPSDKGAAILSAIENAQTSVHMTMYLLTDKAIIGALGDLKTAGKDVQVTLNKTFPSSGTDEGTVTDNQPAFDALSAAHVDVTWAPSKFTYTHEKGIIIDGQTALIMTMNLTETSPTTNREYIATDTDPDDVATMEKIFAADHAGQSVSYASKLVISPATGNSKGSPRDYLTTFIDSAKTSLDVEVQELSDYSIVNAIIAAKKAGKTVQVIVDGDVSTTNAETTVIAKLKSNGIPVHSFHSPDLHAKAVVVDGKQTWVGSQNFTATALDQNREVGVFTDVASEVAKVKDQIDADYQKGDAL